MANKLQDPSTRIQTTIVQKKNNIYSNCFNGSDLLKWISSTLKISKEIALPIAKGMHNSDMLEKIEDKKKGFSEGNIYRLNIEVKKIYF